MMKRRKRWRSAAPRKVFPALAVMAVMCFFIRAISGGGTQTAAGTAKHAPSRDSALQKIAGIGMGLGDLGDELSLLFGKGGGTPPDTQENSPADTAQSTPAPGETVPPDSGDITGTTAASAAAESASEGDEPEQIRADVFTGELDASGIALDNDTDYEPDLSELLNEPLSLTLADGEPSVLIIHTHGSEAYMPDGTYVESDPYRTTDSGHNVVGLGEVLSSELESYGIGVIHDTALYDYPEYNGSYQRSMEAIESWLARYPSICAVIDLHRDAISDVQGRQYKTVAQIDGSTCSQVLIVAGTDYSGLEHPQWRENLKLAVHLQYAMDSMFPSLAKPINISKYRYNQHETSGSLIIEMGCTGNSYAEAELATRYFAEAYAETLLE